MWKYLIICFALVSNAALASNSSCPPQKPAWYPAVLGAEEGAADKVKGKVKGEADEGAAAALDAARRGEPVRVVVLQWKDTDTDYANSILQRNVRTRIARPDAKFYPDVDIYQVGRQHPDPNRRSIDQTGVVPDSAIPRMEMAVASVERIPWNGLTESDWGIKAHELRNIARDEVWFVDRPELREALFQLYVQIGRAADNENRPAPPFFEQVGGMTVNYYWYLAGAMAYQDESLLASITDGDLNARISYYTDQLKNRGIPLLTLAFEEEDGWSAEAFAEEFTVFINGLEVAIDDPDSLFQVPPGRVDVYMKRTDGHSLSDRIEIDKPSGKYLFVRQVARKAMGVDFIEQLMKHPNECTPQLSKDLLDPLAIYANLHPGNGIYVAVPEAGNPSKIFLWRFDRNSATLQQVQDEVGGFPVRFVLLGGTGMIFNGVGVAAAEEEAPPEEEEEPAEDPSDLIPEAPTPPSPELSLAGIPFDAQLRGHVGRLMVVAGIQGVMGVGEDPWMDEFQSDGYPVLRSDGEPIYKERSISRLLYGGLGVVLMKDAGAGIGPRGYVRAGMYDVPHLMDLTLHLGMTTVAPVGEANGRFQPLVDADLFVGALIPVEQTYWEQASLNLGLTASAGFSF